MEVAAVSGAGHGAVDFVLLFGPGSLGMGDLVIHDCRMEVVPTFEFLAFLHARNGAQDVPEVQDRVQHSSRVSMGFCSKLSYGCHILSHARLPSANCLLPAERAINPCLTPYYHPPSPTKHANDHTDCTSTPATHPSKYSYPPAHHPLPITPSSSSQLATLLMQTPTFTRSCCSLLTGLPHPPRPPLRVMPSSTPLRMGQAMGPMLISRKRIRLQSRRAWEAHKAQMWPEELARGREGDECCAGGSKAEGQGGQDGAEKVSKAQIHLEKDMRAAALKAPI
ncbi:hypothetical protein BDK51DRAFT_33429 [Blyttiomyces helicus]|uniref:Uncharacterized protein n=1 Tax=Blyttiomyces helicus TaxID=388810 RepID=A0A4P9W0Q4_9FUNG|nr:hypothetical protein BDK51DRAFT_33429 [Blyttiomyces helicus]|eukprot:RKO83616.1 hypothetical protein BDK51DRAFT_33429 [Blyttiomyces helicus]